VSAYILIYYFFNKSSPVHDAAAQADDAAADWAAE